jgi:hypothetical protein
MRLERWELPGPSRFVGRVDSDLRQGKNVVLCVPSLNPGDLLSAISTKLEKSWRWSRHVPNPDLYPLDQLERHPGFEDGGNGRGGAAKVQDLTSQEDLEGLVVAVDLDGKSRPGRWCRFLSNYSEHLRHMEDPKGPRFILRLSGGQVREAPSSQVRLSIRKWEDTTREIDVRHVAEREMESRGLAPLQHRLAVEMIVRLALWDLDLAAELSRLPLKEVSSPKDLLKEYAEARGWKQEEPATWFNGTRDMFLGEEQVHSALCAIQGNLSTIERRIWAAQTAVMFPYLEARLRDLVQGLDCLPDFADVSSNGNSEIVGKEEFELSDVHHELQKDGRASPELKAIVKKLKRMRNRIAHHEPLRASELENSFSQFSHEVERN